MEKIKQLFRIKDHTGQRVGLFVVTKLIGIRSPGTSVRTTMWEAQCDCGKVFEIAGSEITRGKTRSCGCYRRINKLLHGFTGTRTYESWAAMLQRCNNKNNPNYKKYGGNGITVCKRWHSFVHFLKDMGERPIGTSLDRYPDKRGKYQPNNCRWATPHQQTRNKNNNIHVMVNGNAMCVADAAKELGIAFGTVINHIKKGKILVSH